MSPLEEKPGDETVGVALYWQSNRLVYGVAEMRRDAVASQITAEVGAVECPEGTQPGSTVYTTAGVFTPYVRPVNLAGLKAAARERVDAVAIAEQAVVTGGKGQIYAVKQSQAERVLSGDPVSAAEVPLIAAEAALDGMDLFDVAVRVAIRAYEDGNEIAAIETRRLVANRTIDAAADPSAIAAAEAAFADPQNKQGEER